MALVNQDLYLEITPGAIPKILNVSEYDENMQVIIHLRQRGQAYEIPSGTTAKVEGTLAGHPFRVDATPSGSTVSFELSKAMTGYAGRAWTKIKLINDDKPVHTCGFWLDCDRAGVEAGDVIAMSGFEQQLKDGVYDWMDENSMGLKYWLIHQSFDSTNPAAPSDMPVNSYTYTVGSRLGDGWFDALNTGKYYFIYCYANAVNPAVRHYQVFERDSGNVYEGYSANSGATVSWARAGKGLEYWLIHESYDSSNPASPSDMPINSYFYSGGSRLGTGWFSELDTSKFYFVYCYANGYNPAVRHYQAFESLSGKIYEGFTTNGGAAVSWAKASGGGSGGRGKTLKVLSIGSSFGQDCTVYAPWLMEEMDADTAVTFGIVYMSGGTISQYNGWFDDGTALNYYKRATGADAWASGTQKSLKAALDDEAWDVILVNQSAYDGGVWSEYAELETYLEKIVTYIGHPVKLGYLMPQAALKYASRYTYADLAECAQKAYDGSVVSFVVPAGTAIENARNTSLNSVGDRPGGLAADETGHLQEGLPVLIANYVTAAKLLEVTQGGIDKIMGCTLTPTTVWVTSHNIPGVNPNPASATGVTAANILLGQRCAVQAVKKPYEVSV